MNAAYWNTLNEGGEGFVKHAPVVRSKEQIECELFETECSLKSAKLDAAYKDDQNGTAYKVERLEKKLAELKAEMGAKASEPMPKAAAPTPAAALASSKKAEPAGKTYFYVSGRFTRDQLIGKREKAEHVAKIGGDTFGAAARAEVAAITKLIGP